jgi:hypothetical protein
MSLNDAFSPVLQQQVVNYPPLSPFIDTTVTPPRQTAHFNKNIDEHDKISKVKGDLDEVRSVMVQNIEKVRWGDASRAG